MRAWIWKSFSKEFRLEFRDNASPFILAKCKSCGNEFQTHLGLERGPDGLLKFYSDPEEFCSAYCASRPDHSPSQ